MHAIARLGFFALLLAGVNIAQATPPNPIHKSGVENSICFNGVIEDAEQCDDNNATNGDGCASNCRLIQCGDGAREPAEDCDDGSIASIDGCGGEFCEVTQGWFCGPSIVGQSNSTSVCVPICGDGLVRGGEACDDNDIDNGDGCSGQCLVEPGYLCSGEPSTCALACGNGVIDSILGEQCDGSALGGATCFSQGFNSGTLSCSLSCQFDTSACVNFSCGNNVLEPGELCDGPDLGGQSCISQGFGGGTLTCNGGCDAFITSGCGFVPTANAQSVSVPENSPGEIVTLSGSDPKNSLLDFAITTSPINGSLLALTPASSTTATIKYVPNASFVGADSFAFQVNDGLLNSTPATVSVTVTPVCGNGNVSLPETCDDSNLIDGDGCSSACTIESGFSCSGAPSVCISTAGLKINEVDYDQAGTDTAEYIELLNTSSLAIPLSGLSVVLFNGSTSPASEYAPRFDLSNTVDSNATPVTAIPAGAYLVIGPATVTSALPTSALRITVATPTSNIMQNGAPDGLAIVNTVNQTVIDALSYEGSITAAQVTGFASTINLVEGTAVPAATGDSNSLSQSFSRLPNGTDTGNAATDWTLTNTITPGAINQ